MFDKQQNKTQKKETTNQNHKIHIRSASINMIDNMNLKKKHKLTEL